MRPTGRVPASRGLKGERSAWRRVASVAEPKFAPEVVAAGVCASTFQGADWQAGREKLLLIG